MHAREREGERGGGRAHFSTNKRKIQHFYARSKRSSVVANFEKKKKIEFVSQPSCKQSCHEKHNQISNLVVFLPRENLPLVAKLPVDLPLGSQIYKVAFGGGGRGGEGGLK